MDQIWIGPRRDRGGRSFSPEQRRRPAWRGGRRRGRGAGRRRRSSEASGAGGTARRRRQAPVVGGRRQTADPGGAGVGARRGAWSNDPRQLCYWCDSCKAGMLGTLRDQWRRANVALVAATVALLVVYVIGCSAFKNAQTEDLFRRYKWSNNT